jgi:hypothetical protein
MPRPSLDLEPYKAEIIDLYKSHTSTSSLCLLAHRYGVEVTSYTIDTRLRTWGIKKQNHTATLNEILHTRIKVLFYQVGLEEKEMLHVLQQEGFNIEARTLKYIRHR